METKAIQIPIYKNRLRRLLSYSVFFLWLGIWIIIRPDKAYHSFSHSPLLVYPIGIADILFCGVTILVFIRFLLSKYGIKLSAEGVYYNTTAISPGLIPWNDIGEVRKKKVFGQTFVLIFLKNSQSYIDKQTNFIKKKLLQWNLNTYGTIVHIPISYLRLKNIDLEGLLNEKIGEFTQNQVISAAR